MRIVPLVGIVALALVATRPAQAQWKFGPEVNWASNSIGVGLGGRVEADLAKATSVKGLGVEGAFNVYFPAGTTFWEIDGNGTYHFAIPTVTTIAPYAGAGLAIFHDVGTAAGLNLFGGTQFTSVGKITPFAELRLILRSGSAFVITGGVLF